MDRQITQRFVDRGLNATVPAQELRERDGMSGRRRFSTYLQLLLFGVAPEPVPSFLGLVEPAAAGKVGVSCSGGGIRSASFNLGALQALSRTGQLQRAAYLAGVSGGSYIAAGMSMVGKSWGPVGSPKPPMKSPRHDDSDPDLMAVNSPFYRGSPEEQYLRNRSSYLAPGAGGKLHMVYRVLLGLAFNLLFLTLLLAPTGFALGLVYRATFPGLLTRVGTVGSCVEGQPACTFTASPPSGAGSTILWLSVASALLGLLSIIYRFKHDSSRGAVETWSLRLLVTSGVACIFVFIIPATLAALRNLSDTAAVVSGDQVKALGTIGGTSLATVILGVLLQLRTKFAEPATALQSIKGLRRWIASASASVRRVFIYLAGAIAGPLLLLAITLWFTLLTVRAPAVTGSHWLLAGASLVAFLVLYLQADLTTWSLHPFYRRRLSTAFALKRVRDDSGHLVAQQRDYNRLVPLSKTVVDSQEGWPTLLVCAAANISNPGATPPGRGVTSFTFSAYSIGGPLVGAVPTQTFEDTLPDRRQRDFSLIAAVAMSGAALSPSMGKHTRRPLTFLLALANVRLGVWVPNPRRVYDWRSRHLKSWVPRPRPSYLLRELLGLNSVNAKFLYVTDGGHYENLGLVELLRRGCSEIYCFDASGGQSGTFATLGDAIALARSELNVEIKIDPSPLAPESDDPRQLAKADCATGTIEFPDGTSGHLVYARTVVTKDAPWDVHAYHEGDSRFPNHPTADQLYTDQKFEAYRALGELAGRNSIQAMDVAAGRNAAPRASSDIAQRVAVEADDVDGGSQGFGQAGLAKLATVGLLAALDSLRRSRTSAGSPADAAMPAEARTEADPDVMSTVS